MSLILVSDLLEDARLMREAWAYSSGLMYRLITAWSFGEVWSTVDAEMQRLELGGVVTWDQWVDEEGSGD